MRATAETPAAPACASGLRDTGRIARRARATTAGPVLRPPLQEQFGWAFLGNTVYAGSQWAMLFVLARLGAPDEVGRFALGFAITAPVFMLANLQLRALLITDVHNVRSFGEYLGARAATCVCAFAVSAAVAYLWLPEAAFSCAVFIAAAKAFESMSDITYGLLQRNEAMRVVARSLCLRGLASVAVLWLAYRQSHELGPAAAAVALSWGLVLVTHDLRAARRQGGASTFFTRPAFSMTAVRSVIVAAAPLGLSGMLCSLTVNIPKYVVQEYWGESALGVFAALSYLFTATSLVVTALAQASTPRLAAYSACSDRAAFRRLILLLVSIGIAMALVCAGGAEAFGRPVLAMVYGPEYVRHEHTFTLLAFASGITAAAAFLNSGLTALRAFRAQLLTYVGVTFSISLSSWLLVPRFALPGAAVALVIGSSVQVVVTAALLRKAAFRVADAVSPGRDRLMFSPKRTITDCADGKHVTHCR